MRTDPDLAPHARAKSSFLLRRLLPLAVLAAVMILAFALGWHRVLSLESLVRYRADIDAFIDMHRAAALGVYMTIYIAAVSLSLPGSVILTIAGGLLFGLAVGGLAAIVAATIGAVVVFLIAKSVFGEQLIRRAGSAIQKLAEGFRADAFSYLLFLRLVPIFPFWLVNLAAALFNVRLTTFAAATAIGIVPGAFAFAFIGTGLDSAIAAEAAAYRACLAAGERGCRLDFDVQAAFTPRLVAALAVLGLLALVPPLVRRFKARRQAAGSTS